MATEPSFELTPEELRHAMELRPRVPLNEPETKYLRDEVIPWHERLNKAAAEQIIQWWIQHDATLRRKQETRKIWSGRFRLIFTSLGGIAGLITVLYNIYSHFK